MTLLLYIYSVDHTKTSSSSQLRHGAKIMSRTEAYTDITSDTESVGSASGEKDRHRTSSNPSQNPPQTQGIQKRKVSRQSMPYRLPQTFLHPSSQSDKQSTQQSDNIRQDSTTVCSQSSTGQNVLMRPNSVGSQDVGHKRDSTTVEERKKDSTTVEEHKKDSTTVEEITRKAKAKKSDRRKTQSDACFIKHSSKTARTNSEGSGGDLVSQERSSVSEGAGSDVSSSKSVNKKRKLLNPSQEFHVLSPSPTDNPNLPKTSEERPVKERQGRTRKSCDMDAIFPPSSLPAPKRGRGTSQMKENLSKRMSSTQADGSSSDPSRSKSKSSLKGTKRSVANGKESVQKSKGDESVSSSLHSTARSSSILGASMSMVFNDSSRGSLSRLAPPINSLAEFKVAKPQPQPQPQRQRQGKRAPPGSKGGSSSSSSQEVGRDPRGMSHKFRPTSMPSLVMTSLHRLEQDLVIRAVKKLGVFRVEDRVSKHSTHLICGEPRRTLNVLNAMERGCWLVDRQWVVRSMEDGRWLGEEDYEMVEDFPQCKETHLVREAEDPGSYQCCIFESAGSMFVSNECTPPRTELVKLLQLCGAKVTDTIQRADFYIGDSAHDDKNSIKPVWVLDCISEQELLPMDDYILAINHKAKKSSSPEF